VTAEAETLFGIRLWHPDVRVFAFGNLHDDGILGSCWLDLYPREGKYSHAACYDLVSGYQEINEDQQLILTAVLCNFTAPTESNPSLLNWGEVETLFHEFGHALHNYLGGYKAKYVNLAGTSVKQDFVEAPSQMLEQWLTSPEVIQKISRHYQNGTVLPASMLSSLVSSSVFGETHAWLRVVGMAYFDQRLHQMPNVDSLTPNSLFTLWEQILTPLLTYPLNAGTYINSWGHLGTSGYAGVYYSYVISMVIASDLYSLFEASGNPLDSTIGMLYRQEILEPGGSDDPEAMISRFLGRPYNEQAFLRRIGAN